MDPGLDENQAELGVLVLSVALKMLADGNGLLNQHVKVFGDLWGKAVGFEDSKNLVTRHNLDLSNAMGVSQDNADLGRCCSLLGQLADLVHDLLGSGL